MGGGGRLGILVTLKKSIALKRLFDNNLDITNIIFFQLRKILLIFFYDVDVKVSRHKELKNS